MSNLNLKYFLIFILAGVVSFGVTALVRRLALNLGVVDEPRPSDPKKIHDRAVPLLGGFAIYVAVFVSLGIFYLFGLVGQKPSPALMLGLLLGSTVLIVGGYLDDKYDLPWYRQIISPLLATVVVIVFGLEVAYVTNPIGGGFWHLDFWRLPVWTTGAGTWYFVPVADLFAFVWIMGMIYTTKLLDGIDGLASSISTTAAAVIFIVSLFWDRAGSTTSFLALALVGAGVGFLFWNWHPAKIFLGEGGSTLLGYLLAVLAIMSGGKVATTLLLMGVPIFDVAWSIVRRWRTGMKIFSGDDRHLHFRLMRARMSQPTVVLFLSLLSLAFGSVSLFFNTGLKLLGLGLMIIFMIGLNLYLSRSHEPV